MKHLLSFVLSILIFTPFAALSRPAPQDLKTVKEVKAEIFSISEDFKGQGDPNFEIQNTLMPYINRLLALAPQSPVRNRVSVLAGPWKQVWGPYEYRKNDRSVDPATDPDSIYQVVFEDGYYYNVGNTLDITTGNVVNITLLRGEFDIQPGNDLKVQFTSLRKIDELPSNLDFIDLPELSEAGTLEGEKKVLPDFIVRRTFKGGVLTELYTDRTLRLAIGNSSDVDGIQGHLYVMERVAPLSVPVKTSRNSN